jgi:hypothetical protein
MRPVGFEPTIQASERPQAQALDRAATGIGGFEPTIPASEPLQTHALDSAATEGGKLMTVTEVNTCVVLFVVDRHNIKWSGGSFFIRHLTFYHASQHFANAPLPLSQSRESCSHDWCI